MMRHSLLFAFAALAVDLLTACAPAFADTATAAAFAAPATNVDFSSIVMMLFGTIAAGVAIVFRSLVASAVSWIEAQTEISISKDQRALIDAVLSRAIDYGIAQAEAALQMLGADGKLTLDTHNEAIQHAADYALTHIPDALGYFGIDRAGVIRMVTARMVNAPPALALGPSSAVAASGEG